MLDYLPPKKECIETLDILRADSKAASALGELKGIAKTIPNQKMLVNAIVLQEAKDSSEIENIITTQDELYSALSSSQNQSSAVKEVINYRSAIFSGNRIIKDKGYLNQKDLLTLQETIIGNKAGFRKLPGTVLKNDKTGEVVYTPPQKFEEIVSLIANFLDHFNIKDNNVSPLINLAILHYQFESIHPFYDGNGRTGRILNILYLIINNLIDVPILYLSSYIIANKKEYYELLNAVNHKNEWEPWIIYMLKAIEKTARNTTLKIESINTLLNSTLNYIKDKESKAYNKELIELLFEQPYSRIAFVSEKLKVERKAASRYLKKMEEIGILKSQKIGREILYINHRLIQVLKEDYIF